MTLNATTKTLARSFCLVLSAVTFLTITSNAVLADERCRQLEALNRQYMGVSLTSDQQALKRRLVAWYNANCRTRRASAN